jgi:hypothetical protein
MINLELHITLKCNSACPNCNRLCNIYRDRTEHMSIEQIQKFIDQAKNNGGINKLKVLGGEPLLHPQFVEIYNILASATKDGIINYIKIESNKTVTIPKVERYNSVWWKGRPQSKKKHLPFLWSPKDLGVVKGAQPNCRVVRRCGYSLDKYGYLPCSCAIMISRLFGNTDLYSHEFPKQVWGLDKLCQHCIFSMDQEWKSQFACKRLSEHTIEEKTPTKSYQDALDKWDVEKFYKTQKEF